MIALLAITMALALAGVGMAVAGPAPAWASDNPPGFWYGTDSWPLNITSSGPYREPVIGGNYGGYMGEVGSWSWWLRCPSGAHAWSKVNSAQADTNFITYHRGVGTGGYWFMGGPGVDPHYNGSAKEAYKWGVRQAERTLSDIRELPASERITYPVLWMDIEFSGVPPAPDNGWDSVYTSPCSGQIKQSFVPVAVDRADYNGYWDYIKAHSSYRLGVYSAAVVWSGIFGAGPAAAIPNTYEWTFEPETASLGQAPSGWCLKGGGCAHFFGGITISSPHALMWQFSGGGGIRNGYGDFDQIDGSRVK